MNRLKTAVSIARISLLHLVLALGVAAAMPVLAGLVLAVRLLIPVLFVISMIALAVSPTLRRGLAGKLGDRPSW